MSRPIDLLPGRLALPLTLVAALGIALSLVRASWFFLGGAETDMIAPLTAPAMHSGDGIKPLGASEIAALNLFGTPPAADTQAVLQPVASAPDTPLQLTLQGVFLAEDPAASSIIMAERRQDPRLYRIGDQLPGNAVLLEILRDRIVLRRAGQLEVLKFPDAAAGADYFVSDSDMAAPSAMSDNRADSEALRPAADQPVPRGREQGDRVQLSPTRRSDNSNNLRTQLRELNKRLTADPAGTLTEFGVQAVSGSNASGYRLGSAIPAAKLAQAGLKSGDVILSVNGEAVGNIQQDRARLEALINAGVARLEIQRGDRRFFVTTRLR